MGANNHSVTENGTDKNGANGNNVVDDNATTDSNGTVNDRSDTKQDQIMEQPVKI